MANPANDAEEAGLWMRRERERRGWSTTKLADVTRAIARREGSSVALAQQSISDFEQPGRKRVPQWFTYVKMAFEEGEPPAQQEQEPRDDLVYLRKVDIRFAMGDGTVVEDYPATSLVPFNLGWLKTVTTAPTEKLFIATGQGNSMEPDILANDEVLIDTTVTKGFGDTVWAFEYAGTVYIKRLRPILRDGKRVTMILSANSLVPDFEADAEFVHVIGRVAWISRKLQ